jgi:ribosome-associated protein
MSIQINQQLSIPFEEVQVSAVRAQGAGGQNVNKVSSAIHLRFDVKASSLPDLDKERLLQLSDRRINSDGVVVIKAQRFRSQEKNRADAYERLKDLVVKATTHRRKRRPTKPSFGSKKRRLDSKNKRGNLKDLRGKVDH